MKLVITRPNGDKAYVLLLKNKNDGTYSYVNITKGHICPCRFNSINEAIEDTIKYQKDGKIKKWEIIDEHSESQDYYCTAGVCPDLSDEYDCNKCTLKTKVITYNGNKQVIACRSYEEWEAIKDLVKNLSPIKEIVGCWKGPNSYAKLCWNGCFAIKERKCFSPELEIVEAKDIISCGKVNIIGLDRLYQEIKDRDKSQVSKELF